MEQQEVGIRVFGQMHSILASDKIEIDMDNLPGVASRVHYSVVNSKVDDLLARVFGEDQE